MNLHSGNITVSIFATGMPEKATKKVAYKSLDKPFITSDSTQVAKDVSTNNPIRYDSAGKMVFQATEPLKVQQTKNIQMPPFLSNYAKNKG